MIKRWLKRTLYTSSNYLLSNKGSNNSNVVEMSDKFKILTNKLLFTDALL